MVSRGAACYHHDVPPEAGPGPIATVHRITIWTALLGAIAYLAWEVSQIVAGDPQALARAALALAGVVAIGLYLRSLRGRLDAKLTPGNARRP